MSLSVFSLSFSLFLLQLQFISVPFVANSAAREVYYNRASLISVP